MNRSQPAHEIRLGQVQATIWEETIDEGIRHTVTVHRLERIGDRWLPTERFEQEDLPVMAEAVDLAHLWICEQATLFA